MKLRFSCLLILSVFSFSQTYAGSDKESKIDEISDLIYKKEDFAACIKKSNEYISRFGVDQQVTVYKEHCQDMLQLEQNKKNNKAPVLLDE